MVHLAAGPPAHKHPLHELAAATGVQESFLSKILQRLVHQGLLLSQRGSGGGFVLNRAPDQLSLLDVVEAIEGPTQLNQCVGEAGFCKRKAFCGVSPTWERAQAASRKFWVESPSRNLPSRPPASSCLSTTTLRM